jgi:hypothetical protein
VDAEPRQLYRQPRQRLPLAGDARRGAGRGDLPGLRRLAGGLCGRRVGEGRGRRRRRTGQGRPAHRRLRARHGAARQVRADWRGRARVAGQGADREIQAGRGQRAAEVRHRDQGVVASS